MPVYLDHHAPPKGLGAEQVKQMQAGIKASMKDKNGVRGINGFWNNNEAWCLVEAPNAQAVHKYHEEVFKINLGAGEVKEVQALMT